MTTAEKNLWQWLKTAEQSVPPGLLHWQRIENSARSGTPDVEGYYRQGFVIELKSVRTVAELKRKLTTEQIMFLTARVRAGGSAWLLVQIAGNHRYLIHGAFVKHIQSCSTEDELVKLHSGVTEITADAVLRWVSAL